MLCRGLVPSLFFPVTQRGLGRYLHHHSGGLLELSLSHPSTSNIHPSLLHLPACQVNGSENPPTLWSAHVSLSVWFTAVLVPSLIKRLSSTLQHCALNTALAMDSTDISTFRLDFKFHGKRRLSDADALAGRRTYTAELLIPVEALRPPV